MARNLRTWLGGCLLVSALGMVPPPKNIRVNSVNFKNILQWESPLPKGNLTFTVQYQSYSRLFQDKCKNTNTTECDFSDLSKYGNHTLRVRTELTGDHSDWVNITFSPVDETNVGPPGIQVDALVNSLHVHFLSPKIDNEPETWTMKNIYNSWTYNVQYWKNGSDEKASVHCQHDSETLRDLEPQTTYCVQAQVIIPDRNKAGEWSEPVCEQTAHFDTVSSWVIALVVLAASVCVALLLLGCFAMLWCIYEKIKYTFSHQNTLPRHLKEFLGHPHHSPLLIFSFPFPDEHEVFDKLSMITEISESGRQNPGKGGSQEAPSRQGSCKLGSEAEAPRVQSSPLLTTASDGDHTHKCTETT
ncbi:PREDICTED: interleukin-10 receptor subunit beta [Condylura cristata]|uniref:interleukin-10 receptor subunit beta n=1 Tax=Condylura cristata TaxID=143302 RepID=UPI00033447C7|nr:PREDICTED: interleukin-10 receptor subunit beta [Condylura cristata]